VGDAIVEAVRAYADEVRTGAFPGREHAYKPNDGGSRAPEAEVRAPLPH
jgi:hypothetical protein